MIRLDGKQKVIVSISTLGLIAAALTAGAIKGHEMLGAHLNFHLMSRAEAQIAHDVQNKQIQTAVDAAKQAAQAAQTTSASLDKYVRRQDLKEARAVLAVLLEQLSATKLWETANSENDISRARKRDLERQIDAQRTYIGCLESGDDSCIL